MLGKDESCPTGSAEVRSNLCPMASHYVLAESPLGKDESSSCLLHSYPMGPNASVIQLSHPGLHPPRVSLVLIQEPQV